MSRKYIYGPVVASSDFTEDTVTSKVLTEKEFKFIAPHLPVDILFATPSFKFYQIKYINLYGREYQKVFRELENDNQRYIVFLWVIGCQIWKWNNAFFDHERADYLNKFSEHDWTKATDTINYLGCCVCLC